MFEPENDLERALVAATTEPAARPALLRMLMDAQVFTVLIPEGSEVVDGQAVSPEGGRMILANFLREDETYVPFFTAGSRASAYFGEAFPTHMVAPVRTRDLFERHPEVNFQLNPGSEQTKVFTPDVVARCLAGQFEDVPQTRVQALSENVLLAHPKQRPEALIAALTRELTPIESVRGAWLMLSRFADEAEQSWMIGLDVNEYGDDVHAALQRALANGVLDRPLHQILLERGHAISQRLRTGIPIVHKKKRGFFNFFRS
jgi:hypothetical protein